jgi:sugar O-acyltransferase (sialic acid O-acetyltransferase NeuD family)
MSEPRSIVILGAGGMAHIVYWQLRETTAIDEFIFIEDESDRFVLPLDDGDRPILKEWRLDEARAQSRYPEGEAFQQFTLAVSDPVYKQRFVEKALALGLEPAPTFIHPAATVSGPPRIGRGGFIAAQASVLPVTELGDYITMAPHSSIGHHCRMERYGFLAAGSVILGNVTLEEGVWIGGGATVRERVRIAPWTIVGAQSAVISNIDEPGSVVAGVPARPIKREVEAS